MKFCHSVRPADLFLFPNVLSPNVLSPNMKHSSGSLRRRTNEHLLAA